MRMRPCPCLLLLLGVILCPSAEARKDDSEGRVSSAARAAATAVKSAAAKVSGAGRSVVAKVRAVNKALRSFKVPVKEAPLSAKIITKGQFGYMHPNFTSTL